MMIVIHPPAIHNVSSHRPVDCQRSSATAITRAVRAGSTVATMQHDGRADGSR